MEPWRKHAQYSVDEIEIKLLVSDSKSRIHEGSLNPQCDKLESTREKFEKDSTILLIIIYEKRLQT